MLKSDKDRILKAKRKKLLVMCKRTFIKPSVDFSSLEVGSRKDDIFKVLKEQTANQEYCILQKLS